MWRASIFTLFPAMFPGPLGLSLAGEARVRGLWDCETFDIRDYGLGRHRTVDDRPAGGGPGMVMRADVVAAALDAQLSHDDARPRLVMSPRGVPLNQKLVRQLADGPGVAVLCGRFEGIDERVIGVRNLMEVSVGDYVLSGGELGALVLLDACVRLLPGVMGAADSEREESFENGLLEYPHYTRPRDFEGIPIPEILLSGDHARIAAWRQAQSETLTRERRPDLLSAPRPAEAARVPASPRATKGRLMSRPDNDIPAFGAPFACADAPDGTIAVRHKHEGYWWRFEVADKNGRLQLVHQAHGLGESGDAPSDSVALDAFDFATLEARRKGWVD